MVSYERSCLLCSCASLPICLHASGFMVSTILTAGVASTSILFTWGSFCTHVLTTMLTFREYSTFFLRTFVIATVLHGACVYAPPCFNSFPICCHTRWTMILTVLPLSIARAILVLTRPYSTSLSFTFQVIGVHRMYICGPLIGNLKKKEALIPCPAS